jgi:hypothetical protein
MEYRKQHVFTDAGKTRRDALLQDIEKQIDDALAANKFVPGVDVVEITGSDVDELARNMQVVFRDRQEQRQRNRDLLLSTYMVLGAATTIFGLFFDRLKTLMENPTQFLLVASGFLMVALALLMRVYLRSRDDAIERKQEYFRFLQERERRSRESDA